MSTRTLDAAALGERPVGRLLWHACTQTTIAVGVYGIYALTNAWFVARGVGTTAMAAVNLVAPLLLALGALSTALGVGAASVVSRHLGSGDTATAARSAGNAFVVFWTAAVATTMPRSRREGRVPMARMMWSAMRWCSRMRRTDGSSASNDCRMRA